MTYALSTTSKNNMAGLHPTLLKVVNRAIQITKQDFGVTAKQVRTAEEQNALYKAGKSQKDGYKNKSNHQTHSDGYGHAVDLTAYTAGSGYDFNDWNKYYEIASAMSYAAKELTVPIRWGGNWYDNMLEYGSSASDMKAAVERYKAQHPGSDFIDGPHFELI